MEIIDYCLVLASNLSACCYMVEEMTSELLWSSESLLFYHLILPMSLWITLFAEVVAELLGLIRAPNNDDAVLGVSYFVAAVERFQIIARQPHGVQLYFWRLVSGFCGLLVQGTRQPCIPRPSARSSATYQRLGLPAAY